MSRVRTTMSRVRTFVPRSPLPPGNIIRLILNTTGAVVQWVVGIDKTSPRRRADKKPRGGSGSPVSIARPGSRYVRSRRPPDRSCCAVTFIPSGVSSTSETSSAASSDRRNAPAKPSKSNAQLLDFNVRYGFTAMEYRHFVRSE